MSVKSVSTGLQPYYGPLAGINSQPARIQDRTFAKARASQVAGTKVASAAQDASVTSSAAADLQGFRACVDRDLPENGTTAERPTAGASGAPGGRSPPGIALYQRVSQYVSNEPSASALLKSWNDIVHGSQDTESGVTAFAKALSQNETLGFESGVLDVTA
jgi:hypothetical protein